jgi:dynein heavy chain
MNKSGLDGLKEFYEESSNNLESIVTMVRGNLQVLEMITLGALIVIEVHNKDVLKGLIDEKIPDINAFS